MSLIRAKRGAIAAVVLMSGVLPVRGQTVASGAPDGHLVVEPSALAPGEMLREIDDPNTGARWLLLRDNANPAGPGRLVLVGDIEGNLASVLTGEAEQSGAAARPVIHTGDTLVVEEHSRIFDARLEAVALGSAIAGSEFRAQLKIGGKVVRAVAIAAGRAVLAADSKAER